jgi:hypothetical protein
LARTQEEEKVWYAAFYLDGDAQQWYFRLERNHGVQTWERFINLVNRRFVPPARSNPLDELIKLQHVGSVNEYQDQFLKLLARCDGVREQQQIAIYTAGLGDPLCIDVELHRPVTLENAMGLSRSYEHCNTPVEQTTDGEHLATRVGVHHILRNSVGHSGAPLPHWRPTLGTRFTRLTAKEMAQRREVDL